MNPKKFNKGKHSYVDWGKGVKEVKKVEEKINQKQLKVNIDDTVSIGRYANLGSIYHSPEEFIFDFMFIQPGIDQAKVVARIVTSPGHAKRFYMALGENIVNYEKKHGLIKPSREESGKIGFVN